MSDFKVAGGLILLVLAIYDLLFASATREPPSDTAGSQGGRHQVVDEGDLLDVEQSVPAGVHAAGRISARG